MDCFLYDNGLRHEGVNQQISVLNDTARVNIHKTEYTTSVSPVNFS